ncbi:hypothetical protein N9L20_01835 [Flavobacteriaceae bacterium]|nr:hypothetical protein [Flavobacteriaceae bacterium]
MWTKTKFRFQRRKKTENQMPAELFNFLLVNFPNEDYIVARRPEAIVVYTETDIPLQFNLSGQRI